MSALSNFYHHEYWNTDAGRSLLDVRRGHRLMLLITQDITSPALPFITLKGEDEERYEGWYISWTNFDARYELTIEFEKGEACIYAMENGEFAFYHSLVFQQALEENPNYEMYDEGQPLTKESLDKAINDVRKWMNKNHHHFAESEQDKTEQLHRAFLL